MHILPRFWKALDEVPGTATDGWDWRERLGEEWPLASRYLRPTGRMIEAFQCPSPGGDGCPRAVIKLPDGRLRAVCGGSPRACDDIDLEPQDVAVLALDRAKFVKDLSAALEAPQRVAVARRRGAAVIPVGRHAVAAGVDMPVVVAIPGPERARAELDLSATELGSEKGVILVPTRATLPAETQARLRASGHLILPLSEVMAVDDGGTLQTVQPVGIIMEVPRSVLLRKIEVGDRPPVWKLPPDARWSELTIRRTEEHEVTCAFRGQVRSFTPADLGMHKPGRKKPSKDWTTLAAFAELRGRVPTRNTRELARVQKRYQLLGRALVAAFGIEPPPIRWSEKEGCYCSDFVISDERPLQVRRNFAGRR